MKADTTYNDLTGTVAADISDLTTTQNDLTDLATSFKIDTERFKAVGISVYGTQEFSVSFICVDKTKSTEEKEHLVKMEIDHNYKDILSLLFKRLEFIIYDKFDSKYREIENHEDVKLSDFKKD